MSFQIEHSEMHESLQIAGDRLSSLVDTKGSGYLAVEPGDATRYEIFAIEVDSHSVLFGRSNLGFGGGAFVFNRDSYAHWTYMSEKLEIKNEHAAKVLADIFNVMCGHIAL